MLEDIRRLVMARMQAKRELMLRSNDEICPNIRKKLEKNKRETGCCHVTPAGNLKFEVQQMERSHVVKLSDRTCSCRYWDISGIPCNHAISCIVWLKEDPHNYVDIYYKKEAYLKTYEFLMETLSGKDTWPQVEGPHVLPPPVKKMPGQPKKKRRREVHEEESSSRLSKRGVVMSCSLCKQDEHNRRSCPLRALASPSATDIEGKSNGISREDDISFIEADISFREADIIFREAEISHVLIVHFDTVNADISFTFIEADISITFIEADISFIEVDINFREAEISHVLIVHFDTING
ncbi:hypothetical protein Cni_G02210 [Canna indica]|uniref:SWIM-type domain-containing protein n=1 Tax=Canna indica TaxID=4628 RepID=A0AAQ3JQK2_9LILI|nr:hypothetical protein Cni_G02210 [Canna indica]